MSTRSAISPETGLDASMMIGRKRRWHVKNFDSLLVLLPSMVAIGIFVYAFIGITFYVSLSNWRTVKPDLTLREPLFLTYGDLFSLTRFQSDLRNTVVFTILFIGISVIL